MRTKAIKRGKTMKMEVIVNGREVPKDQRQAVLLDASDRLRARSLQRRLDRAKRQHSQSPERQSVAIAVLAVEEKIVTALWTIARQPLGKCAPAESKRCGLDYVHDRIDQYALAIANGGWISEAPRPALPSAKDITLADKVQDWLLLIEDESLRKLLVYGATSKRGDSGRQVNWERIRPALPEFDHLAMRTLKFKYQEALRIIVSELTLAMMA